MPHVLVTCAIRLVSNISYYFLLQLLDSQSIFLEENIFQPIKWPNALGVVG